MAEKSMEKIVSYIDDVEKNPHKYSFCDCNDSYSTAYNEKCLYIICDKCGYSKKISYEDISLNE